MPPHSLISTYLSQRPKLAKIAVKGSERVEHYAAAASDQQAGPTLADMLAPYVRDEHGGACTGAHPQCGWRAPWYLCGLAHGVHCAYGGEGGLDQRP